MKLLTKSIIKNIPAIYATENVAFEEKKIVCKFFNPCAAGTWYVLEGEPEGNDFRFFGLVDLYERELGYFCLSELESIKLPLGLTIERDIHFEPCMVKNL